MPMRSVVTDEILAEVGELVAAGATVTDACREVRRARELPIADRYLWNCYYQKRAVGELPAIPDIQPKIPPSVVVPYTDCYIIADLHAPYFHTMALTHLLLDAKDSGIKTAIVLGDALDNDAWSFYLSQSAPGATAQVNEHIEACYRMWYAMCGVFDKLYWVMGNHELRPLKLLSKRLDFEHWTRMFLTHATGPALTGRVETVARYWMAMDGAPTGRWEFHHQRNYSVIPGRVSQRLAAKQECNIVTSHEHRAAQGFSGTRSGHYAVAAPMMADPRKIEYVNIRATLHPYENVGWVVLRDGHPSLVEFTKRNGGL